MWYKVHNHLVHMKFPKAVTQKPRLGRHDHQLAYLHISPRIDAYKYLYFVRAIPTWNGLPAAAVTPTPHPPTPPLPPTPPPHPPPPTPPHPPTLQAF